MGQSNHHHQRTNTQFFYRPDALPVAQPTVSKVQNTEGKISHSMDLLTPSSPGGLPTLAPGYLGGGLPCLSSALWCQYPIENSWLQNITNFKKCSWVAYGSCTNSNEYGFQTAVKLICRAENKAKTNGWNSFNGLLQCKLTRVSSTKNVQFIDSSQYHDYCQWCKIR